MTEPECVWPASAMLGEGTMWHAEQGLLYWVDIKNPAIHALDPETGARRSWPMPEPIGFVARRRTGGLIAGFKSGISFVDLDAGRITQLAAPEDKAPGTRFNDGKCDHMGRLWAGTMDDALKQSSGWLYRIDDDGRCTRTDGPYVCTNGPAFSPDFRTLYHTDTIGRTIYAFDLADDGRLSGKRVFVRFEGDEGYPDGMTVDRDGFVWVAHWGGWRVTRFLSSGQVDRVIRLPIAQPTNCAFGGPDLTTLFITSACDGLDAEALAAQPLAGGLFAIETDVQGLPPGIFFG